ncbi:MAG: hypothetical protein LBM94_01670 [Propionibacteriaceae bacterium]|nr:hypothetical protein [Propionibacteriaceae bacterium]
MWTWQFAKAQHAADLGGWKRFISMQDQYSLLSREEEREMHLYCIDDAIASLELQLSEDEVGKLEAPYVPRLPGGF